MKKIFFLVCACLLTLGASAAGTDKYSSLYENSYIQQKLVLIDNKLNKIKTPCIETLFM